MENLLNFLNKKFIVLSFCLIIVLAFIFRFYGYEDRYALGPDQAGFAMQAKYAVQNDLLPLLGPFSSAGPFQTGGEWYWFIMLGYLIFPAHYLAPWIFLTLTSILFILILMLFAKKIIDTKFALIVGLLSAFSTAQITQSINLTNQSPMALFSLSALISAYQLLSTKKVIYSFIMGLSIGLASSIHLQGIAMMPIFLTTFFIGRIISFKKIIAFILGGTIPWIPVLMTDLENNLFTIRNMFAYYITNDNKIPFEALGRRWLTFVFEFIPESWANVIGGNIGISYLIIILACSSFLYLVYKRQIKKEWLVIFISLAISIILVRYTRTPIFYSYVVFLHPQILLITGLAVYLIYKKIRILGLLLLAVILIFSAVRTIQETNITLSTRFNFSPTINKLISETNSREIKLYDYNYITSGYSLQIGFLMEKEGNLVDHGYEVGIAVPDGSDFYKNLPLIFGEPRGEHFYSIGHLSDKEKTSQKWIEISPGRIYNITQNWYK